MSSGIFKKSQIQIRILVGNVADCGNDPTLFVNSDQNSGILMKNLKNFDQNTGKNFGRFLVVNQSDHYGILKELNFDQNTGEKFEGFRSEIWNLTKKLENL